MEENNEQIPSNDDKAMRKTRFRTLVIEGTRFRTNLTTKYENRGKWVEQDENKIISIIPGTIVTVFVRKGQKVKEGESLLVLESMKMQNQICAPHNGVIKSIKVAAGQVIPKGYTMIELE
jgi:biotin carboxyl carrier protein